MSAKSSYNIANVPIDEFSNSSAIDQVANRLENKQSTLVVTPNSEMVMQAQRNTDLMQALQQAHLRLADSVGITWAVKKLYRKKIDRISGSDFAYSLADFANRKQLLVLLVGRSDGLDPQSAQKAKAVLSQKYPSAKFQAYVFDNNHREANLENIRNAKADIVLLGLGTPLGEVWANQNIATLQTLTIVLCCGGGIDFIAGVQKRAPKLFRKLGLEWLWRLLRQPKRIFRQFALVKFVAMVWKQKRSHTG